MKDLRNKNSNIMFRGKTIFAENNTEARVNEMLNFMGVKSNSDLVQTACGYLSMNNMEVNINNIETFLKEKNIVNTADLRKKAYSVVTVNSAINNVEKFCNRMQELGYKKMTNTHLTKDFNTEDSMIQIDIKFDPNKKNLETITGYKDSKICDIEQSLLDQIGNDIDSAVILM